MPIKPLAEIRIEHPFYSSGLCDDARIIPDASTAARLRGLRLITKETAGGLVVLAELGGNGTTTVPIPRSTLSFELLKLPPELEAATNLVAVVPGTAFIDAGAAKPMKAIVREKRAQETMIKPDGSVTLVLAGRPRLGTKAADFQVVRPADVRVTSYEPATNRVILDGPAARAELDFPVAPTNVPGTLAVIEIGIGPEMVAKAAAGNPRRFTVALKPAAARWCYHLITDLANPLAEWRITHAAADGPPASFAAAGVAEIAAIQTDDPFGSELLQRSAPLRVLRFISDAPVVCSEKLARRVALFVGDRQLFPALPNPPPTALRLIKGEQAFGEVLRFVTA